MKQKKTWKQKAGRLLALLLAVVMVFALPMEASAATTRKVTALNYETNEAFANYKKLAPAVKVGKNQVICKTEMLWGEAVVKFTATKTKTYSFTFKNLRALGKTSKASKLSSGAYFFSGYKKMSNGDYEANVPKATIDGKAANARIEDFVSSGFKKAYDNFGNLSTTVKIKMKKGQTLYLTEWTNQTNRRSYDLIIK